MQAICGTMLHDRSFTRPSCDKQLLMERNLLGFVRELATVLPPLSRRPMSPANGSQASPTSPADWPRRKKIQKRVLPCRKRRSSFRPWDITEPKLVNQDDPDDDNPLRPRADPDLAGPVDAGDLDSLRHRLFDRRCRRHEAAPENPPAWQLHRMGAADPAPDDPRRSAGHRCNLAARRRRAAGDRTARPPLRPQDRQCRPPAALCRQRHQHPCRTRADRRLVRSSPASEPLPPPRLLNRTPQFKESIRCNTCC